MTSYEEKSAIVTEHSFSPRLPAVPKKGVLALPSGHTLYWELDESCGVRNYYSDECGAVAIVWSAGLIHSETLLAAIVEEARLNNLESEHIRRENEINRGNRNDNGAFS